MTSNPSQKISHQLNFGRIKGKEIIDSQISIKKYVLNQLLILL